MSQLDTFTNMLTGLSRGTFDELILYRGGSYQDLNTILNGLGGGSGAITVLVGAGAAVISGTGSSRTITVDLSSHATTAAVNALLANYVSTSAYIGTQHFGLFIPRHRTLSAPASLDHPAPAPCHCHGYPQQVVPRVAQSILGPARLVSATPPT